MIIESTTPHTQNQESETTDLHKLLDNFLHFRLSLASVFRTQRKDDPILRKQSYVELWEEGKKHLGITMNQQATQDFCYQAEQLFISKYK